MLSVAEDASHEELGMLSDGAVQTPGHLLLQHSLISAVVSGAPSNVDHEGEGQHALGTPVAATTSHHPYMR